MVSTVQGTGGGCMVWGMFNWKELELFVHVDQCITGSYCHKLFADCTHPTMLYFYLNGNGVFQDYNMPWHQVIQVQEWLEHHSDFQHINWPPNILSLNPTEYL